MSVWVQGTTGKRKRDKKGNWWNWGDYVSPFQVVMDGDLACACWAGSSLARCTLYSATWAERDIITGEQSHVLFFTVILFHLDIYQNKIAGSYDSSIFNCWGTSILFSMVYLPIDIPTNSVPRFCFLHILNTCYLFSLW